MDPLIDRLHELKSVRCHVSCGRCLFACFGCPQLTAPLCFRVPLLSCLLLHRAVLIAVVGCGRHPPRCGRGPTAFLYGDHDWMDAGAGKAVADSMKAPAVWTLVPRSGHQLFLDNSEEFDARLLQALDALPVKE